MTTRRPRRIIVPGQTTPAPTIDDIVDRALDALNRPDPSVDVPRVVRDLQDGDRRDDRFSGSGATSSPSSPRVYEYSSVSANDMNDPTRRYTVGDVVSFNGRPHQVIGVSPSGRELQLLIDGRSSWVWTFQVFGLTTESVASTPSSYRSEPLFVARVGDVIETDYSRENGTMLRVSSVHGAWLCCAVLANGVPNGRLATVHLNDVVSRAESVEPLRPGQHLEVEHARPDGSTLRMRVTSLALPNSMVWTNSLP